MFSDDRDGTARLKIKICGITNAEDAQVAIECGADAIGINCFRGSKRFTEIERAGDWLGEMQSAIAIVAVLVNATWEETLAIAARPYVSAVQLHGDETPAFCARLAASGVRFGKALPVTSADSLGAALRFSTSTLVLDSARGGVFGGSGKRFNWEIARDFVAGYPDVRVILAGGLDPGNVADAVLQVRPFGVDVTTGVESAPGRKDHGRLRAFVAAARAAS